MAKKWMKRYVLFTIWTGNAIKMGKMTRSLKKKKSLFGEALFLTTSHLVVLLIL